MHVVPKTTAASKEQTSAFLKLPGELRNVIYRLVLVQDSSIRVRSDNGYARSGLFATCRQVRTEVVKIYYYENKFELRMADFNSDILLTWTRMLRRLHLEPGRMNEAIKGNFKSTPDWKNLMLWLRRKFEDEVVIVPANPAKLRLRHVHHVERFIVGGMFATLEKLREQPWSVVEAALSEQRLILGEIDHRWVCMTEVDGA